MASARCCSRHNVRTCALWGTLSWGTPFRRTGPLRQLFAGGLHKARGLSSIRREAGASSALSDFVLPSLCVFPEW